MSHTFAFVSVDEAQALFECSVCHRQIGFVLPGLGEPHAIADGDAWTVPEGADDYLAPCDTPVDPVVPVPDVITKRQFLIQLLRSGMVDPSEVATLAIQPPALMAAVIAGMATEAQLEATLSWAAMTQVERYSPLTVAASAAAGTTTEQLDDFFRAAALI